jgi:hypothetical protein
MQNFSGQSWQRAAYQHSPFGVQTQGIKPLYKLSLILFCLGGNRLKSSGEEGKECLTKSAFLVQPAAMMCGYSLLLPVMRYQNHHVHHQTCPSLPNALEDLESTCTVFLLLTTIATKALPFKDEASTRHARAGAPLAWLEQALDALNKMIPHKVLFSESRCAQKWIHKYSQMLFLTQPCSSSLAECQCNINP